MRPPKLSVYIIFFTVFLAFLLVNLNFSFPVQGAEGSNTLKVFPTDDTTVKSSNKDKNYANDLELVVDGNPDRKVYLKFDLSNIKKEDIASAKFVFMPVLVHTSGQGVFEVKDTSWTQKSLTYNNRPTLGKKLATIQNAKEEQLAEVDLTSYVKDNAGRQIAFAIENTLNSKKLTMYSKEAPNDMPYLLIEGNLADYDPDDYTPPASEPPPSGSGGTSPPDTTQPQVSITSPANNATISGNVLITANATDNVSIENVKFYIDGNVVATDTAAPYEYPWDTSTVANGSHVLRVRAFDTSGNVSASQISVNVNNATSPPPVQDTTPPQVTITSPANDSVVSGSVNIQANVSDASSIQTVDFYINGSKVSSNSSAPYFYVWNIDASVSGQVVLNVKAADIYGNVGESSITVSVESVPPSTDPDTTPIPPPPGNPPQSTSGVWLSLNELKSFPKAGEAGCDARCAKAWNELIKAADTPLSGIAKPNVSNQDETTGHYVLAKAYAYAKTGDVKYRNDVLQLLRDVIGTDEGSRSLALGRKLPEYIFAADIINLSSQDPDFNKNTFVPWASNLLTRQNSEGRSLEECHQDRPNNWGTHCGSARTAISLFLLEHSDDNAIKSNAQKHLDNAVVVYKGYLGDRSAYSGFKYGDLSWQCSVFAPVGINPQGCRSSGGHLLDGALPEEMRRTGSFKWPPPYTSYAYGGQEGADVQAYMLSRKGHDVWNWSDRALYRAVAWMFYDGEGKEKWDTCNNLNKTFVLDIVDKAYNSNFVQNMSCAAKDDPASPGRNVAWTSWTHRK